MIEQQHSATEKCRLDSRVMEVINKIKPLQKNPKHPQIIT